MEENLDSELQRRISRMLLSKGISTGLKAILGPVVHGWLQP
jgi:hypothetical protein